MRRGGEEERRRERETSREREKVLLAVALRHKQFPLRGDARREREKARGRGGRRKNEGRRNGKKGAILLAIEIYVARERES